MQYYLSLCALLYWHGTDEVKIEYKIADNRFLTLVEGVTVLADSNFGVAPMKGERGY